MGGEPNLSDQSDGERRHSDYGSIDAGDDDTVISKGSLDPVYEAKAKILNRAVSCSTLGLMSPRPLVHGRRGKENAMKILTRAASHNRFKILAWAGTNGSSS